MNIRTCTVYVLIASSIGIAFPAGAAAVGLTDFGGSVVGQDGQPDRQAGGHPDIETHFTISSHIDPVTGLAPDANIKDVTVDLPKGLIGNPSAVPTCPDAKLSDVGHASCPANTQVGFVSVTSVYGFGQPDPLIESVGLYNADPPPGVAARFGFNILNTVVVLDAQLTATGDYHVRVVSKNTSQGLAVVGFQATLWGVPASPKNDARRGSPSDQPLRPFVSTPTACSSEPLVTSISMNSWQDPGTFGTRAFDSDSAGPLATENCAALPFDPAINLKPTTASPDTPTGLDVNLTLPQNDSPDGLSTAHLKDVEVTLPEGLTVNPGSADGLTACTDAQLGLGNDERGVPRVLQDRNGDSAHAAAV